MSHECLNATDRFGCDTLGRLTRVLVHRPGDELNVITAGNCREWLFDAVPDVGRFREEHEAYTELLRSHGVEVLELADHVENADEKLAHMPNVTYLHDTAVISKHGAMLSSMAWPGRRNEHLVVREALENLGIPIFSAFDEPHDAFEGCLLLSPRTILVAETERHSPQSIRKFITQVLAAFEEVIYVKIPRARRYMHPDTIYNRITERLALAYLPAIQSAWRCGKDRTERIDFADFLHARGIELVSVSDAEQRRLACSFVPLEPGVIFHYDTALDAATRRRLARKRIEIIPFHPQALRSGGGSLRCMTLRLHRANGVLHAADG